MRPGCRIRRSSLVGPRGALAGAGVRERGCAWPRAVRAAPAWRAVAPRACPLLAARGMPAFAAELDFVLLHAAVIAAVLSVLTALLDHAVTRRVRTLLHDGPPVPTIRASAGAGKVKRDAASRQGLNAPALQQDGATQRTRDRGNGTEAGAMTNCAWRRPGRCRVPPRAWGLQPANVADCGDGRYRAPTGTRLPSKLASASATPG